MRLDKRKCYAAVSAGALLAAAGSNVQAATILVVTDAAYSGSNYDVLFPTVKDATDLFSISSGSVNTGEFGSFTISAIFQDDQVFQVFSSGNTGQFDADRDLSFYTENDFTPFAAPSDVKGVRFVGITGGASGAPAATLALPVGTVLTFTVVPEPATALLIVAGLFLIAMLRNGWFRRHAVDRQTGPELNISQRPGSAFPFPFRTFARIQRICRWDGAISPRRTRFGLKHCSRSTRRRAE